MAKEKPPKLPAAVFKNALVSVDKNGMVEAEIDPKWMNLAIVTQLGGPEKIAAQLKILLYSYRTPPKVKLEAIKFAYSCAEKAAGSVGQVNADLLTLEELKRQRDQLVAAIMDGPMTPERLAIVQKAMGVTPAPAETNTVDVEVVSAAQE